MKKNKGFIKHDVRALQFKYGTPEHKFYDYLMRKENIERFETDHIIGQVKLTRRTIANDLEISEGISRRLLKQFQDLGIIKPYKLSPKTSKKPSIYMLTIYENTESKINQDDNQDDNQEKTKINGLKSTVSEVNQPRKNQDDNQDDNPSIIDNIINNKINNNIDNVEQLDHIPYTEIINYLNTKTNKHFKESIQTKKLINGRFREGYNLEDFKKVIDVKTQQWIKDPKMNKYLRPDTLFRPSNFENYLNEYDVKSNVVQLESRGRRKQSYLVHTSERHTPRRIEGYRETRHTPRRIENV